MGRSKERRLEKEKLKIESEGYEIMSFDQEECRICLKTFDKIVTVRFGEHYPFYSPEIFIDDLPYHETMYLTPEQIKIFHQTNPKECCLICSSLACKNNWNVCKSILHILQDVEQKLNQKEVVYIDQLWIKTQEKFSLPPCSLIKFFKK